MILRQLEEKDTEYMLEWMHDADIQKCFRRSMKSYTQEEVLEFIRAAVTEPKQGKDIHFAIVDDCDEYMGTISLKNIDMISRKAEYAISTRKKAWGKGFATKATHEILRIAFEQFALEKVYLNVLADNINAIHLYERCGFSLEGEFRKELYIDGQYKNLKWYSILREEYIGNTR